MRRYCSVTRLEADGEAAATIDTLPTTTHGKADPIPNSGSEVHFKSGIEFANYSN